MVAATPLALSVIKLRRIASSANVSNSCCLWPATLYGAGYHRAYRGYSCWVMWPRSTMAPHTWLRFDPAPSQAPLHWATDTTAFLQACYSVTGWASLARQPTCRHIALSDFSALERLLARKHCPLGARGFTYATSPCRNFVMLVVASCGLVNTRGLL
jgi:hypothetical protein